MKQTLSILTLLCILAFMPAFGQQSTPQEDRAEVSKAVDDIYQSWRSGAKGDPFGGAMEIFMGVEGDYIATRMTINNISLASFPQVFTTALAISNEALQDSVVRKEFARYYMCDYNETNKYWRRFKSTYRSKVKALIATKYVWAGAEELESAITDAFDSFFDKKTFRGDKSNEVGRQKIANAGLGFDFNVKMSDDTVVSLILTPDDVKRAYYSLK